MKKITLSSFKGGVGKSSIAVLLGTTYASAGMKVLIIDLDHQRNATTFHATELKTIAEHNIAEAFHRGTLNGNILPSHIAGTDFVAGSFGILQQRAASAHTLRRLLEPIEDDYDICIIDTPPTLDNIVLNAWTAADRIVTPARLDGYDLDGVATLGMAIEAEQPERLPGWSVILNFYRPPRTTKYDSLSLQMEDAFWKRYSNLSAVRIPDSTAVHRAIHNGEAITPAQRTKKVYEAFTALASDLIGEPVNPGGTI